MEPKYYYLFLDPQTLTQSERVSLFTMLLEKIEAYREEGYTLQIPGKPDRQYTWEEWAGDPYHRMKIDNMEEIATALDSGEDITLNSVYLQSRREHDFAELNELLVREYPALIVSPHANYGMSPKEQINRMHRS